MTLELSKITQQVDEMGQELAGRATRQRRALPPARELLHVYAHRQEELRQVAESEHGQRLRCASPGDEPLDGARVVPKLSEHMTVIAADGSQIYPDQHGVAFYFLINVGSIVFRHGSGQAPLVATVPRLFYAEDQVYPSGDPISSDLVSARRGLAEMQTLADLAQAEPANGTSRVALTDGPLLLWVERTAIPTREQARILADYLACLDRIQRNQVPVAGFVSRPHSAEVVTLLYLAQLEPERRPDLRSLHDTAYRGLTDRALFGFLEEGQRSALFVRGTAVNQEFRRHGHAVFFFYLCTGPDVARVEVPEWVVDRNEWLDLVQAAVYDQCRLNNGYPYVLTRADEQAVILGDERELLEAMIVRSMAQHGLDWPQLSRKAQQKQVARWRRR